MALSDNALQDTMPMILQQQSMLPATTHQKAVLNAEGEPGGLNHQL